MRIVSLLVATFLGHNAIASGCMASHLEGTIPGASKPAMISSIGTAFSAFILSREPGLNEEQDKIPSQSYVVPALYVYTVSLFSCHSQTLEEYQKTVSEANSSISRRVRYGKVPTKTELEDRIKSWRKLSRITVIGVGGYNLYSLTRIYKASSRRTTKGLALISAGLTIASAIYDYDNTFNNKKPPWANFDVVTTEVSYDLVPSLQYTYNF